MFTVPFDGTCQFTFSGNVDEGNTLVELTVNGQRIGSTYGSDDDTVDFKPHRREVGRQSCDSIGWSALQSINSYTHFTGQLVAAKC